MILIYGPGHWKYHEPVKLKTATIKQSLTFITFMVAEQNHISVFDMLYTKFIITETYFHFFMGIKNIVLLFSHYFCFCLCFNYDKLYEKCFRNPTDLNAVHGKCAVFLSYISDSCFNIQWHDLDFWDGGQDKLQVVQACRGLLEIIRFVLSNKETDRKVR